MKTLLGCLMCLVLTLSQAFAISGGPFGGKEHVSVTGTFAGVMVPIVDPVIGLADNSLALFSLSVPQTGRAAGLTVTFRNGLFYPGIIDAVADPNSAKITAIVNGNFQKTFTRNDANGVAHDYTFNFDASGRFEARVAATRDLFSTTGVRLRGSAAITYTTENDPNNLDFSIGASGGPIQYSIQGFKQSNSSS
jgi:hypothetical protein